MRSIFAEFSAYFAEFSAIVQFILSGFFSFADWKFEWVFVCLQCIWFALYQIDTSMENWYVPHSIRLSSFFILHVENET